MLYTYQRQHTCRKQFKSGRLYYRNWAKVYNYAQVLVCSTYTHCTCIICIYKASLFEDDVVSWFCRLNFSTAFSTNAVSMFHSVGLMKVTRVEKSMRYMLKLKRRNDVSGYCEISEVIIVCFFD